MLLGVAQLKKRMTFLRSLGHLDRSSDQELHQLLPFVANSFAKASSSVPKASGIFAENIESSLWGRHFKA